MGHNARVQALDPRAAGPLEKLVMQHTSEDGNKPKFFGVT
jgi:hypothetical protein